MEEPVNFMETPLITWVQTFNPSPLQYSELIEGVFLNEVMQQIDPRCDLETLIPNVEDTKESLHNLDLLVKNLKAYYHDVLQQLLVMRTPNLHIICRNPESEQAKEELTRLLLLILGCAVQCERKEQFIEMIKELDIKTQHAIVEYIKEITDDSKSVFSIEVAPHLMDDLSRRLYHHLQILIEEREGYIEEIGDLSQGLELYQQQLQAEAQTATSPVAAPPAVTPEKHHLGVELAESKAKLRHIRQELEEKTELVAELREELEESKATLTKIRQENLELVQNARAARTYRDEIDILKEKASRVDKYESEISRYKERLNELDFYKARVEELREDNAVLAETRTVLEDQLETSQKRVEVVIELENELMRCKQELEEVNVQRDEDRNKIQDLLEENARLEFEKKSSLNESGNLGRELEAARTLQSQANSSISEQLSETANAKILRIELENQRLQKQLDQMRDSTLLDNNARVLELEKENHRLAKKVEKLQQDCSKENHQVMESEQKAQELQRECVQLQQTIDTVKESTQRQVAEMERENEQLTQTIETLRQRNEKTVDLRVKDIEKENKRMHDTVKEVTTKISQKDEQNRQLQRTCERLQANVSKTEELEVENQKLEREYTEAQRTISTLKLTCDKYDVIERECSDLEVENQKLHKTVDSLKSTIQRYEEIDKQNINLTVENQRLTRTIETVKNSSSKIVDLESEKEDLTKTVEKLKRALKEQSEDRNKLEQLEINLFELDTENQKLQRNLEAMTRKMDQVHRENTDLENENQMKLKSIETLKVTARKLDDIEKDNQELDIENEKLTKERNSLEKEIKKYKQSLSVKELSIDELTAKVSSLERENKTLQKNIDRNRESGTRIKEMEQEFTEIVQQASVDKKTLATLREDLVNEKIKTQQLSNELDKLNTELERVGLNKKNLMAAEKAQDESRYKVLETMMQDTLKKSVELKDEKILALQSRLEESKERNKQLYEEMKTVKSKYEALQQRREEEIHTSSSDRDRDSNRPLVIQKMQMQSTTREILDLKDHLIRVERLNASLEADNRNLSTQMDTVQERIQQVEARNSDLQSQNSSVLGQSNNLQSQNAKLQVETTTLKSQNASLLSQNADHLEMQRKLETEREQLVSTQEELQGQQEMLVSDHEALQKLHESLTTEYEALIAEHNALKLNYKSLKTELKGASQKNENLIHEKETIRELKESLERERVQIRVESKSLGNLQTEHNSLREENQLLKSSNEKLSNEYKSLFSDYKSIKTEYNNLQLRHTKLQGEVADYKDQLNIMDVEVCKMANKCEALTQLNHQLEEENRSLMMQLQALLTQNQELLTNALSDKDAFHEEERIYRERLNGLQRQKEKLEEKIMEQYKRYDSNKKKSRSFGSLIVRKAKGYMAKHKGRNAEYSPDSSSLGSREESVDGGFETSTLSKHQADSKKSNKERRNSVGDILDSPRPLAKQNKSLARSTTALSFLKSGSSSSTLRVAKSSENLLNYDSTHSGGHQADIDSLSSSNSAPALDLKSPGRLSIIPRGPLITDNELDTNDLSSFLEGLGHTKPPSKRQGSMSSDDNIPTKDPGLGKRSREPSFDAGFGKTFYDNSDDNEIVSLRQMAEEIRSPETRRRILESKSCIDLNRSENNTKVDLSDKLVSLNNSNSSTLPRPGSSSSSTPRSGSTTSTPRMGSATSTPRDSISSNLTNNMDPMNVSKISRASTSSLNNYPERLNNSFSPAKTSLSGRDLDLKTSTPKDENSGVYNVRLHADRQRVREENTPSPSVRRRASEAAAPRAVVVRQPMHRSDRSQSQSSYPGERPSPTGQSSTLPKQRSLQIPLRNGSSDNLLRQNSNDDLLRDNLDNNNQRRRSTDLLEERSSMPSRSVSSYQLNSKTQNDKNHNAPRYVVSQRPLSAYHSNSSPKPYSQDGTTNRMYSDLDNAGPDNKAGSMSYNKNYQDNRNAPSGQGAGQPPAPPPRKAKPGCSIGNPTLAANRRSGAFQPVIPADHNTSPEGATGAASRPVTDSARTLQKTEDRKATGRETPPKPSQDGQTKEKSIWYEYGCV